MTESTLTAALLEATALAPDVTAEHVVQVCHQARTRQLAAVCVAPAQVAAAARLLQGSSTITCAVVGYPAGAGAIDQKVAESATALDDGALEINLILNSAALRAGDLQTVRAEILAVAQVLAANPYAMLKAVVDASVVEEDGLRLAARLAIEGGAHYVTASRDAGTMAPSPAEIAVLHEAAGTAIGVTAMAVNTAAEASALIAAGASRLGSDDPAALLSAAG